MLKKLFLAFFLFFSFSIGSELKLEDIYLENLPQEYKAVFEDFLFKNFDIKRDDTAGDRVKFSISWGGVSYSVCAEFHFLNGTQKISCFTTPSGEELYEKFFSLLKDYQRRKPALKNTDLSVAVNTLPKEKKIRIVSEKRDILTTYKKARKKEGKPFVEGNLNLDTVSLDEKNAKKLLELLLKGYRIKEILIIKK